MVPFLGREYRNHQVPSPWAHRVKSPPLFIDEGPEGHPSTQPSPRRRRQTWVSCSLPPVPLFQGSGLKSLDPLAAAIRLERPRGQNHSQCAPPSGKTPTTGALRQGKERGAKSFTWREVQKRLGQEAQSVSGPQKVTMTRRTGWRSTTTLPSKSLSPEEQSQARAI